MSIYSFPTLEQLKKQSTEEQLRGLGLGYRAKYIIQTRDLLIESGGKDYLLGLRSKDSETVQEELLKFSGIGRKVADCVALFSLDQSEAIPVDVHVQHIASRDYDPTVLGQAKSLTPTIYKRVGDLFRDRFEYAGWAHSLLFVAELPSFRNVLPEDVVAEMDAVS
jgi:N-glycosylase/DNA lyase